MTLDDMREIALKFPLFYGSPVAAHYPFHRVQVTGEGNGVVPFKVDMTPSELARSGFPVPNIAARFKAYLSRKLPSAYTPKVEVLVVEEGGAVPDSCIPVLSMPDLVKMCSAAATPEGLLRLQFHPEFLRAMHWLEARFSLYSIAGGAPYDKVAVRVVLHRALAADAIGARAAKEIRYDQVYLLISANGRSIGDKRAEWSIPDGVPVFVDPRVDPKPATYYLKSGPPTESRAYLIREMVEGREPIAQTAEMLERNADGSSARIKLSGAMVRQGLLLPRSEIKLSKRGKRVPWDPEDLG